MADFLTADWDSDDWDTGDDAPTYDLTVGALRTGTLDT